jgi:hypothetical protein
MIRASTPRALSSFERLLLFFGLLLVSGDDLILKMEDGSIRHLSNVPKGDKVDVDGRQLGVRDLKPGMKLQHTLTVTTTPQVVTTVHTVSGKIFHVTPPNALILTLEDGTNQRFKIPQDQKFNVNGQMVDAFALKKGMNVTATKIVEASEGNNRNNASAAAGSASGCSYSRGDGNCSPGTSGQCGHYGTNETSEDRQPTALYWSPRPSVHLRFARREVPPRQP